MRRSVPLVLLMALLAGCSDDGGSPAVDDDSDAGNGAGDPTDDDGDETVSGSVDAAAPQVFPISWDGKFGQGACIPSGPNGCSGAPAGSTEGETDHMVEVAGSTRWEVDLEVTWETTNPLMAEFVLKVYAMESCGDGCRSGSRSGDSPTGPSPLTASETITLEGNQTGIWIQLDVPRQTPSPVYAQVTAETPFHVEGTLTAYFD